MCDVFKRARFFEEVCGAGDDLKAVFRGQETGCLPIEIEDVGVAFPDEKEDGSFHVSQRFLGGRGGGRG